MQKRQTVVLPQPSRGILSEIAREQGVHRNNVIRWYYLGHPATVRRVAQLEKARNKERREAGMRLAEALGAGV